jgi:hypothetical protein
MTWPERVEAAAEIVCRVQNTRRVLLLFSFFSYGLSDLADALNFSCSARRLLLVALLTSGIDLARSIFGEIDSGEIDLRRRMLAFRGESEPDFANIRRPLGTIP